MDNQKKLFEGLLKADGIDPTGPTESERAAFGIMLDEQTKSRQSKPGPSIGMWRIIMKSKITKFVAAAVLILAILIAVNQSPRPINMTSVAWSDVVNRFDSIAFFNASVYMKENATDQPIQIELWRNSRRKARIRVDSQVLFADGGQVVAGYAIDHTPRKIEIEQYDETCMAIAQKLFAYQDFSLDTVIEAFGLGKDRLKETTPLINPAATISEDMLVFDVQSDISPEWVRIWVLRESHLPIRIRSWDPRKGNCVDIVMSYSAEQSAQFFDPNAYEKVLLEAQRHAGAGERANLAYALLNDPGGKDYCPKDLFEKAKADNDANDAADLSGYHLPKVERAGVSEYGAVWVVASKSENRRPDGRKFFGFSDVSDDLERKYRRSGSTHNIHDVSINVFVPEGYPLDPARPKELALRCSVEAHGPYEREILVGYVKLDNWQKDTLWPKNRFRETELQIIVQQAWRKTNDRETCEKILQLIRQLDTKNKHSHSIEKIKLRMLVNERNYKDAALLAEKLLPAEFEAFKKAKGNASYRDFYVYIVTIAANEDVQRAVELFNQIKQLKPDLSKYNNRAKKHITERLARQVNGGDMYKLIESLFGAGLDLKQVNMIVGFDVLKNEETKWYVPEKFKPQRDPHRIKQEAYLKKLGEYYKANPLGPGQMVFNECKLKEIVFFGNLAEVKDHYFHVFSMNLHGFLNGYKAKGHTGRVNRIKIAEGVENPDLQHEIICNSPKAPSFDEYREFVMSQFDLEAIESQTPETVLIAEYDGSERKDYRDVRSPVILGPTHTPGMRSFRSTRGFTLRGVLDNLARDQKMMVFNNTGIDDKTIVTQEVPNFKTSKGMELAEKWYKDNFGITLRKETRKMPVWTIRKKP